MPKTRAVIIAEATLKARRPFLRFNRVAENEILDIFTNAKLNLVRRIAHDTRGDQIIRARRVALLKEVDAQIAFIRSGLNPGIKRDMRRSIDLGLSTAIKSMDATDITFKTGVGTSFIGKDGIVRRYAAATEVFKASQWSKINDEAMNFLVNFRPTGNTFSQSVWGTTQGVQTRLRTMTNRAILLGDSSQRLARDITAYMSKEGLLVGVSRKKAYQDAWRLARTEMNRAYTEGQIRYAKSKPWIDGVIWRRGGPGPCTSGQCPAGADRFYPKDNAPQLPAHPNCMCYYEQHIQEDPLPEGVSRGPKAPQRPIPIPPSKKNAEKVPSKKRDKLTTFPGKPFEKPQSTVIPKKRGTQASLNRKEQFAIKDYSTDKFLDLNNKLRSGATLTKADKTLLINLKSGLGKLPVHQQDVFRKVSFTSEKGLNRYLQSHKSGSLVLNKMPTSTSTNTNRFTFAGKGDVKVTIKNSISGRDISSISRNPNEREVLFDANSQFRVLSVEKDELNAYDVVMEQVS